MNEGKNANNKNQLAIKWKEIHDFFINFVSTFFFVVSGV